MDDPNSINNGVNGFIDNGFGGTTFTQGVTDSELSLHGQSHNMNNA